LRERESGDDTFPALSVQVPLTDADAESGPLKLDDVQEAIPEVVSAPETVMPTGWLYQPFESGARTAAIADALGGVESYLKDRESGADTFPALSVHVPDVDADAESGPLKLDVVQEAIPEVASAPETVIPTGWLYQPFVSGERSAVIVEELGGVASYSKGRETGADTFPALSVQVPSTEADTESGPL
jgi:hypothetical protein